MHQKACCHTRDLYVVFFSRRDNIRILEKEYRFWQLSRTEEIREDGKTYILSRYNSFSETPRPESYREDVETTEGLSPLAKKHVNSHIQAACESGWDFSSRWFSSPGSPRGKVLSFFYHSNFKTLRQTITRPPVSSGREVMKLCRFFLLLACRPIASITSRVRGKSFFACARQRQKSSEIRFTQERHKQHIYLSHTTLYTVRKVFLSGHCLSKTYLVSTLATKNRNGCVSLQFVFCSK